MSAPIRRGRWTEQGIWEEIPEPQGRALIFPRVPEHPDYLRRLEANRVREAQNAALRAAIAKPVEKAVNATAVGLGCLLGVGLWLIGLGIVIALCVAVGPLWIIALLLYLGLSAKK